MGLSLEGSQLSHFPVFFPGRCSVMASPGFSLGLLLNSLKLVTGFRSFASSGRDSRCPRLWLLYVRYDSSSWTLSQLCEHRFYTSSRTDSSGVARNLAGPRGWLFHRSAAISGETSQCGYRSEAVREHCHFSVALYPQRC